MYSLMYFPLWNQSVVPFSSHCCFLTCTQVSWEAGKVEWYYHLFKNFPRFVVIHTVKGFSIVSEAETCFFWNSLAFSMIQWMLAIWSLVPLPFLNPACTSGSSWFQLVHLEVLGSPFFIPCTEINTQWIKDPNELKLRILRRKHSYRSS